MTDTLSWLDPRLSERAKNMLEELHCFRTVEHGWAIVQRHLDEHAADVIRWAKEKEILSVPDATGDSSTKSASSSATAVEP